MCFLPKFSFENGLEGGGYLGGRRLFGGEALREKMAVRGALIRGEALIRGGGAYLGKYGIQN